MNEDVPKQARNSDSPASLFGQIWTIDTGNPSTIVVPATETETLAMYTQTKLNAKDVVKLTNPEGTVIRGVWRPGLIEEIDIQYALDTSVEEEAAAERGHRL